jgi:hypothetical protein
LLCGYYQQKGNASTGFHIGSPNMQCCFCVATVSTLADTPNYVVHTLNFGLGQQRVGLAAKTRIGALQNRSPLGRPKKLCF